MRLLFVNHTAQISGAERGLLDLVRHCCVRHYACHMVAPGDGPLNARAARAGAIPHRVHIPRPKRSAHPVALARLFLGGAKAAYAIRRLVRKHQIDIVHANSTSAHLFAALAAYGTRAPLIWHCRDLVPLGAIGSWCARRADVILATSRTVQDFLTTIPGAAAKVVLVRNGTDPQCFQRRGLRTRWRQAMEIPLDAPVICTIGQLVPWKRHEQFLRAAAIIRDAHPSAWFVVVGADLFGDHPGYRGQLEAQAAELGIANQTVFTGYLEQVQPVLEGSDVMLHAAHPEPFGRVITEAMAMQCPVVAVHAAGPREIIRDGVDGMLVKPDNVEAMAKAVGTLLSNPQAASRMGYAARERVMIDFSADRCATQIMNLYEKLKMASKNTHDPAVTVP